MKYTQFNLNTLGRRSSVVCPKVPKLVIMDLQTSELCSMKQTVCFLKFKKYLLHTCTRMESPKYRKKLFFRQSTELNSSCCDKLYFFRK